MDIQTCSLVQLLMKLIYFVVEDSFKNDKPEDDDKTAEYLCETCGKTCIGRKAKMRHDYRCHSKNGENFYCDLCDKELASKPKFKKHLEGIHHRRRVMDKEGLDSIPEPKKLVRLIINEN